MARLLFLLVMSIFVTACGSSVSKGSSTSQNASPGATSTAPAGSTAPKDSVKPQVTRSGPAVCASLASATRQFTGTPAGSTPAALARASATLKAHEPTVVRVAPASIRGDFRTLFGVLNHFYATLATVNYDYRKLSSADAVSLAASTRSLAPAAKAIQSYLAKNCATSKTPKG